MPQAHGAILRPRHDDGELRMKAHAADIVGVALQRLHARLGLVVPHLGQAVICSAEEVRPVACHWSRILLWEFVKAGHALMLKVVL